MPKKTIENISANLLSNCRYEFSHSRDLTVYADFTYKAAIPLAEVTGADFPIVAFSPADAIGGNYCPIAYSFDGYVEIWAKAIPSGAITIPAITFIVQEDTEATAGNCTKGITNAGGGVPIAAVGTAQLADKAVTAEKIADKAVSQNFTATIPPESWTGEAAPYIAEISVSGILDSDTPSIDLVAAESFSDAEVQIEAWGCVYRAVTGADKITFYATDKPAVDIPVQIKAVRK